MKDYKTLTREKVDAEPGAARYMGETHMMEDWSDKMIDLVLNGPTLNGFRKDEVRAILRQTYTALKQYEQIGPMASPYMNDPSAIVARAFAELYPGIDYHAQFVPDLCDESGNRAFGLTIFPDDGSTPIVCISAEAPVSAAPELLAHELAHVATPEDRDHGEAWKAAEKAIGDKYDEILNDMIPDDDPGVLVPHEAGDGGILAMPLRDNIPDPGRDDWKLTTCPVCGAECWETEIARQALAAESELRAAVPPARSEEGGLEDEREADLPLMLFHAGDGLRESDREQQPPEGPTRGLYVRTPRRLRDVQQSVPAQLPAGCLHRLHPAGRKKAGDQDVAEVVPHAPGKPEGGKRP